MSGFQWIKKCLTFLYSVFTNWLFSSNDEHQHIKDHPHEEYSENNIGSEVATVNSGKGEDTVDLGAAGDLKNSLEKVSEAIYKKFVSDWHRPPEELKNQPLYKEINSGIQSAFSNIQSKTRPLEEYEIIISIANSLIVHFRNKRKKNLRFNRFKTRQEEVDFVRKHMKCLLDYWLPESMQRSRLIYVFLTEILSVNVLEQIIDYYSDFTSINEAIVEALDHEPATQQKEDSCRHDDINQDSTCIALDESYIAMESDNMTSRTKEKRGFKRKCKGLFKRTKQGKPKSEGAPKFRSYCMDNNKLPDDGDVADMGSYNDGEDDDSFMTSVIETSLQMWLQNNWTAKVSERLVEKDEYEMSVYDESEPGTVLWNTKRSIKDFKVIYEEISQKYPDFMKFTKPNTTERPISDAERQFFTSDEFINILLNLVKVHQETEAVLFFLPFEYEDYEEHFSEQLSTDDEPTEDSSNSGMDSDEVKLRTYNLQNGEEKTRKENKSSFIDPQDASDISANRNKSNECIEDSCDKESDCYQPDGNFLRSRKKHKKCKSASPSKLKDMPSTSVTRDEEFPSENADMSTEFFNIRQQTPISLNSTSSNPQKLFEKGLDVTGHDITQTMEQQKQKLQEALLDVLYKLIDEVLAGGHSTLNFLHRIGILKNSSKHILNSIPNIYAEEQIIWYLNQVAELLTSQVRPQQLTPDVLQSKALDLLKNKVQGFLDNYFLKFLLEKRIIKSLKASHLAFQDPLANKETIYGLLEDLTKIITNEKIYFNSITIH